MVKKYTLQLPNRTWNPDLLDKNLKLFLKNNNINMKDLGIPLRFILTGSENAPGLIDILLLLGETKVKNRLSGYISRKNKVDL